MEDQIYLAIVEGELETLEQLSAEYPDTVIEVSKDPDTLRNVFTNPEVAWQMLEILLRLGFDPNTTNKHGWTGLDYAVSRSVRLAVEGLLDAGAEPDRGLRTLIGASKKSENGEEAAHIVELLIRHGADVNAVHRHEGTGGSFTALDVAELEAVKQVLLSHGAKSASGLG